MRGNRERTTSEAKRDMRKAKDEHDVQGVKVEPRSRRGEGRRVKYDQEERVKAHR